MGRHEIINRLRPAELRKFESHLLNDIRALDKMINLNLFDEGVSRIGAEQELFLVNQHGRPAFDAVKLLKVLKDHHFTSELGVFNLEFNLDPLPFKGRSLRILERQLLLLLEKAQFHANSLNMDIILIGILPTLLKSDLSLANMTPNPRYYALNEAIMKLRGSRDYVAHLRGMDELEITHDNVMLEAANTSFQVHFQVSPKNFAQYYNIAQVGLAPLISVAVNSPIFLGKRLWRETRIAIFQQAIETRSHPLYMREGLARVGFGMDWVNESVLEIFHEDISRFRVIMGSESYEDPMKILDQGGIPKLKALQTHNSTIYRWNRPCYGITNGKPHLRIENRVLPSGPTPIDEVANAAFWFGLISGMADAYGDIRQYFHFEDAKGNMVAAARRGLKAQFSWINGKVIPVQNLILEELLPLAKKGLQSSGVHKNDISRYLDVIRERIERNQTGAEWMLKSWNNLKPSTNLDERLATLTLDVLKNQKKNKPVHTWPISNFIIRDNWQDHFRRVEQYMSTDIFTVFEDDSIELVINLMSWRNIYHIPVENKKHRVVGVMDYSALVKLVDKMRDKPEYLSQPVKKIMHRDMNTVRPDTATIDALRLLRESKISCLPVVENEILVGIVTEYDFLKIGEYFMHEKQQQKDRRFSRNNKQVVKQKPVSRHKT